MNISVLTQLSTKSKIFIVLGTVTFVALSFSDVLVTPALSFLLEVSDKMLVSLGLAFELKNYSNSIASANIPFIKGTASGISGAFEQAVSYLTFANIIIAVQIILVNLGKSLLLKLLPIVFLIGVFFRKYSQLAVKLLVISLLINPGLSLYVNGMHYVANSMELDLGTSLHTHLLAIKDKYDKKEKENKAKQEARRQRQLEKAEEKGRRDLSFFKKAEDAVLDKTEDIGTGIEEGVSITLQVLKEGGKEITQLIINLVSNLIVLFVLLPLLYFYLVNFVLKKFFHFPLLKEVSSIENENMNMLEQKLKKS